MNDPSRRGSARVLELIEWLSSRLEPVTLSEVVRALGWPKSSVLLLLRLLVDRGYATRSADQRYTLVRLPGEPSGDSLGWDVLVRLGQPMLESAVSATRETGCLAVLTPEWRVRYLSKVLPDRELRYDRDISATRVAHYTASGLVLLADFPAADRARYIDQMGDEGDRTAAGAALHERLDGVSKDGCAINLKGRIEGAAGIAVPVREATGACVAALNIAGPRERLAQNLDSILSAARVAAHQMSDEIIRRYPHCSIQRTTL